MRGGVRSGAGRPKSEDSVVVRVPSGCLDAVKSLIESYRQSGSVITLSVQPVSDSTAELVRLRSQVESYRREAEMCQAERSQAFRAARLFEERLLAAGISTNFI